MLCSSSLLKILTASIDDSRHAVVKPEVVAALVSSLSKKDCGPTVTALAELGKHRVSGSYSRLQS